MTYNPYGFEELLEKATGPDATKEDMDALGRWAEQYADWNGECWDVSAPGEPTGTRSLYPVYEQDGDDFRIVGYSFDRTEVV